MPKRKKSSQSNNLQLAGIFIAAVLGLIFLSFLVKVILVINESQFDGKHKFNILVSNKESKYVVSLNPQVRSISILKIPYNLNVYNSLEIPIDGIISYNGNEGISNLSTLFLKSELPFGQKIEKLTPLDLLRLSLFTRTISSGSTYQREIDSNINKSQEDTIISLTFTDASIYEENKSIKIVNATNISGLGSKMAAFISNIGGNPVLVTNDLKIAEKSKIIYNNKESYTVKKLSTYFNLLKEKSTENGIADITIIIGNDLAQKGNF
jgi:hypothetical protein